MTGRLNKVLVLSAVALTWLGGCGHNCQNSCSRIYDECGYSVPGIPKTQSVSDCQDECEQALQNAGSLGDYNPFGRDTSGGNARLENEVQAAAWMDCVWSVECSNWTGEDAQLLCWPI